MARRNSSLRKEAVTPSVRSTISSVSISDSRIGTERPYKGQKSLASLRVRKVDLDRDINPAGARRQRGFEQIGAIGCQYEQQVGIAGGAIHRVEQVEQDRAGSRPEASVPGDKVDVLEHNDSGLQVPRELRRGADRTQRSPGEDKAGVARHLAEQVAGGMRLTGPRRSVQQQASLEMLAGIQQGVAMSGDAQCVALHPPQHCFRQDDVGAGGRGQVAELQQDRSP